MDTAATPVDEWNAVAWRKAERTVFKLQKRIYQATQRGNVKAVHRLQRLLMTSWSARLIAVRRVTQDNRGKRSAGVDGVKQLPPPQRLILARKLRLTAKARPTRRVWIPKPGSTEQRPLGIPTIDDRARQTLVKLGLDPEWEARFEPHSYGFRPGRSGHDTIEAIFGTIRLKPKYVLDADIAKCFDHINHAALLTKLATFPTLRRAIRGWLRAGVMDGSQLFPTTEGTPQGGTLSPLLANIALHGLEDALTRDYPRSHQTDGIAESWKPVVIRYADDFVVLHPNRAVIEEIREKAAAWLGGMGLELKPSKTRIVHTLRNEGETVGFNFLGFHVRQFPVGKTHSGKLGRGSHVSTRLGFKTIITPSDEAQRRLQTHIGEVVHAHRHRPQPDLIARLNPLLRGWCRYYSTVCSKRTFSRVRFLTFAKLRRWAAYRHPHQSWGQIVRTYWRLDRGTWVFGEKEGVSLFNPARTPIRRHIQVVGRRSPYDGDWVYWGTRLGRHPELPKRVATLLKWQKGKCDRCGLYLRVDDVLEVDHFIPLALGGKDSYLNWRLVHGHCHDAKTACDGSTTRAVVPMTEA
jgi:RNA-directed DNA polymerase